MFHFSHTKSWDTQTLGTFLGYQMQTLAHTHIEPYTRAHTHTHTHYEYAVLAHTNSWDTHKLLTLAHKL